MKQILCFGDSNTYGLIPGTSNRYDRDTRWTGIVGKKLLDKGYWTVEEGLCGRTTVFDDPFRAGRRGTEMLPLVLETHKPLDIVVLMLGTNDCKTFYAASAQVIGLGIRKLIRQIKAVSSAAKILLISPIHLGEDIWNGYDPEFNEESVKLSKQLGEIYEKIANEEKLHYLAAADYALPSDRDREHLDKEGHKALAQAIWDKLQQII